MKKIFGCAGVSVIGFAIPWLFYGLALLIRPFWESLNQEQQTVMALSIFVGSVCTTLSILYLAPTDNW